MTLPECWEREDRLRDVNRRLRAELKRLRHPTIGVNVYAVVERAVEEGARLGLRRAHKHGDEPSEDAILEHVTRGVMEAISEVVRWP